MEFFMEVNNVRKDVYANLQLSPLLRWRGVTINKAVYTAALSQAVGQEQEHLVTRIKDGQTDRPTQWLIGRVARDKNQRELTPNKGLMRWKVSERAQWKTV